MDKLSRNFEAYTKVMTWMSGEYLNLVRRLSAGEVFHIERSAQESFETQHRRQTWDALLDNYVEWQKTHARDARRRLARAARTLKRMDPNFSLRVFREKWGPPRRSE
jgi:predicted metal-dependent hydrolase